MFKTFIVLGAIATLTQASPVHISSEKRWTYSVANCHSFVAEIYAEAANIDLASVIGTM